MPYFLQILAIQTPFDIGTDKNDRTQFSCNYDVLVYNSNSDSLLSSFADLLSGVVSSSNLALGIRPVFPLPTAGAAAGSEVDGPFVRIIPTAGYSTIQGRTGERGERPSFQVIVASIDSEVADSKAWEIYRLLDGMRQQVA